MKALKPLAQIGATATALMSWAGVAAAQAVLPNTPSAISTSGFRDIPTAIRTIFNTVIAAAGAIFVVLLLVGGVQYLSAAGNEEATAKAKKLLVDAIIGLIIVLAAWAIGQFVLTKFQVNPNTIGTF
ncbi:hypothetical protein HY065_02020 [Candidatus Berkelbacteria bacterium]|nr:hypothetical protein [Candidatus Berkelbacteria bacterium]